MRPPAKHYRNICLPFQCFIPSWSVSYRRKTALKGRRRHSRAAKRDIVKAELSRRENNHERGHSPYAGRISIPVPCHPLISTFQPSSALLLSSARHPPFLSPNAGCNYLPHFRTCHTRNSVSVRVRNKLTGQPSLSASISSTKRFC